jgi:hypothetical protein
MKLPLTKMFRSQHYTTALHLIIHHCTLRESNGTVVLMPVVSTHAELAIPSVLQKYRLNNPVE